MKETSCLKDFFHYVSLNILGMLGLSCYILADTYFVARGLGSDGLAALNLAIPVYSFIHGSGLMTGIGAATCFSIARSRGQEAEGSRCFTQGLALAGTLAAAFVLIGLFLSDRLTTWLGAEAQIYAMCRTYLRVLLLFSPAFLLNNLILAFVRNDGAPGLAMMAMVGGSLSNVVLDYIFIFPLNMGIFGAVFATGLAPVISLLIMSPFFLKKKNHFGPVSLKGGQWIWGKIGACGLSSLVTEVSSGIVMIVFNTILLRLHGSLGVAAYGVIANLALVVLAIFTGIAQGSQPLISRYYGRGQEKETVRLLKYALLCAAAVGAAVYAVVFLGADGITALFNSQGDPGLQKIAVDGMRIYFVGCLFAGENIVLAAYFSSTDQGFPAAVISLSRGFCLIIPMVFLLSWLWGIVGLWLAFPAAELLVSAAGGLLWAVGRRKP